VARRPSAASREKDPAAASIRKFFSLEQRVEKRYIGPRRSFFLSLCSHIIQLTPQQQSAELRNSASAEELAVARRPKEASREKTRPPPVSRGFFSLKGPREGAGCFYMSRP